MSFRKLPIELRYQVYTYLIFDTLESSVPPPLIQIVKRKDSNRLSHGHCKLYASHASPKEIYEHFAHRMIDPAQAYGSMFIEYGTNRPCLSTPRPKTYEEKTLDLSDTCGCKANSSTSGHLGLPTIFSLLVTCRQLAYEIRTWLYPQIIFDFPLGEPRAFTRFIENLLPGTRELVREIQLTMPIHSYHALYRQSYPSGGIALDSSWVYIRNSFDWMAAVPDNLKDLLPNLRTLHVNIWHGSRRVVDSEGQCTGLPAPIGDEKWRKKALEPVLRFAGLPLKDVTVVVDNIWPVDEIWSGDPRLAERKDLAEWLRRQVLSGKCVGQRRSEG